ncbi:MAG: O-antigen ligase family protein [Chloroflexi bacterium]|nr:O-antigen ligase family protein [Chloroflexota bacterium]
MTEISVGINRTPRVKGVLRALAGLIGLLSVLLLAWAGANVSSIVSTHRMAVRGITFGLPERLPATVAPLWGVNTALEQYDDAEIERALDMIQEGGFVWVRQSFPWASIEPEPGAFEWGPWDRIVEAVTSRGLHLVAVLHTAPPWARAVIDQSNPFAPPQYMATYALFVRAFTQRYGDRIDHYEIWDEPNIYPHWGERPIDPSAYARLLHLAAAEVRAHDPKAVVLAAGLAPTSESGGRNMSDILFLRGLYAAGAGPDFDILAAKPYGFWSGPDDRRVDANVLNFSRVILLREEMERHGDVDKPLWAVEFGWNALPPDWTGQPSLWGTDIAEKQVERVTNAIRRAREEWPWMHAMCWAEFQPVAPDDDPVWGFALVRRDFSPTPFYVALRDLALAPPVAYPGRYPADAWRDGLVSRSGDALHLRFWGTDLTVETDGHLSVTVDGEPTTSNLSLGEHEAVLRGEGTLRGFTIWRRAQFSGFYKQLSIYIGLLVLALTGIGGTIWALRLDGWAMWLTSQYRDLSDTMALALMTLLLVGFYLVPYVWLSLISLVLLAWMAYLRLELALRLLVFSVPFFLYPKAILGKAFSLVEILTLLSFAVLALRNLERFRTLALSKAGPVKWRLSALDWAVFTFAVIGALSLLTAVFRGVAIREFRVVVLEPVLLYILLRFGRWRERDLLLLGDALMWSGLAVSFIGLYQYFLAGDVIVAEGVRRMHSVYASPNNLSLFLGRVFPVAFAIAWLGYSRGRRWLGAATALIMLPCLFLTYSRGAWLLGVPLALLTIGLIRGRKSLIAMTGAVVAALLSLLPLAGTQRIASLFNFSAGTSFLRLKLWQAAIAMIRDYPLTGIGLDNFLYLYPRYILWEARDEPNLSHPHNILLDFWTRLGILGVLAGIWLLVAFFGAATRLYRRLAEGDMRALVLGLMASMVDFLAHGLVDNSYFLVDLAFVFMFTLGIVRAGEFIVTEKEAIPW